MNDTPRVDKKKQSKSRSRLIKLELNVASLPDIPQKTILKNEIGRAKDALDSDVTTYSDTLWADIRYNIWRIKWTYRIFPNQYESNIVLWLKGLILYSFIVLFIFGPCAVIVNVWPKPVIHTPQVTDSMPWIVKAVIALKLAPLFSTVIELGIEIKAYFWGLLGGAGAVVSMVKRFESIASQKRPHWLVFVQGLFNPIVGSLSAVIACRYYESTLKDDVSQLPLLVLAFFAGFSERILAGIGAYVDSSKKTQ